MYRTICAALLVFSACEGKRANPSSSNDDSKSTVIEQVVTPSPTAADTPSRTCSGELTGKISGRFSGCRASIARGAGGQAGAAATVTRFSLAAPEQLSNLPREVSSLAIHVILPDEPKPGTYTQSEPSDPGSYLRLRSGESLRKIESLRMTIDAVHPAPNGTGDGPAEIDGSLDAVFHDEAGESVTVHAVF